MVEILNNIRLLFLFLELNKGQLSYLSEIEQINDCMKRPYPVFSESQMRNVVLEVYLIFLTNTKMKRRESAFR